MIRRLTFLRIGLFVGIVIPILLFSYQSLFVSAQDPQIQYGESVSGQINGSGEQNSWRFDGTASDVVSIHVERTSGTLIPLVSVLGPNEVLLARVDWPQEQGLPVAMLTIGLSSTGVHTLVVTGQEETSGAYMLSLNLEQIGGQASNPVLSYGQTKRGEITEQVYRQFWSFRGARGDIIDVRMNPVSGDLDPYLSLTSPEGSLLISSSSGLSDDDAGLFAFTLPSTGTYSLTARRSGDDFGETGTTQGTYDLTLTLRAAGVDQPAASTPLALTMGKAEWGRLTADTPTALYAVDVPVGVISIGLNLASPSRIATVTVMTPNQLLLGTFSGITPMRSSVTVTGRGPVWIEVSSQGVREDDPVDFLIAVDHLSTAARLSRPLLYDQPQRIEATQVSDSDAWHFVGHTGDLVTVKIDPVEAMLGAELRVIGPDGDQLLRRAVVSGFAQALALGSDGAYEIFIDTGSVRQEYRLAVERYGAFGLSFEQRPTPEEQGVLPVGAQSGSVGALSSDVWFVDVNEAQTWLFNLAPESPDSPLELVAENPAGEQLAITVADGVPGSNLLQVEMSHAGRYRINVFNPTMEESAYQLRGTPTTGGTLLLKTPTKGILTREHPFNRWTMDLQPGALLNIQIESLSSGSLPAVHVFGPDGLLEGSTIQNEQSPGGRLTGIPAFTGGRFQVVVEQPPNNPYTAYRLAADVVMPFANTVVEYEASQHSTSEVFVLDATPVPFKRRVPIAQHVDPAITIDSGTLQAARRAEPEALLRGEIAAGKQYDVWSFSAGEGQVLAFSATTMEPGGKAPDLTLLDQNGTVLSERFQSDSNASYLAQRFQAAGTYYLIIHLAEAQRYTLWIDRLSDINKTLPYVVPGRVLAYGSTRSGQLTTADDVDRYVFYGHAGDQVLARVIRTRGDLQTGLALLTADGDMLVETTADAGSIMTSLEGFRLPANGIYQITVSVADGSTAGHYALHLTLDAAENGLERTGGILYQRRFAILNTAISTQHWLFEAESGEKVTVCVEPLVTGTVTNLKLQLADTSGSVFLEKEALIGQGALEFTDVLLPRGGVYQAIMTGGANQAGLYRITLEYDQPAAGQPAALRYGETVGGILFQENYLDVWTFAGSRGDIVSVSGYVVRGDAVFAGLQLRGPNGQALATAAPGDVPDRAFMDGVVLPMDGPYSLVVGNTDGTFAGQAAYELTVHLRDTSAHSTGTLMEYDEAAQGTFYIDDPVDTWLFEGQAGDVVTLAVKDRSPGLLPTVSLVSTDWHAASVSGQIEVLAAAQSIDEQEARINQFILPSTNIYGLMVQDPTLTGGDYELVLTRQAVIAAGAPLDGLTPILEGSVFSPYQSSSFVFTGLRDSVVTIVVKPDSRSSLAPRLVLQGPNGTILSSASALPGEIARIERYPLPWNGTYTVLVSRALEANGQTEGHFTLELQEIEPVPPGLQILAFDQLARGAVDAATLSERWAFEGLAGDVIQIRAEPTSGDLDPVVRVYDPAGKQIAAADDADGLAAEATFSLAVDGSYQVEVGRYNGTLGQTQGNYALTVSRVYRIEPHEDHHALVYGDRVAGTTDEANRSNYWQFVGEKGDVIRVKIQFPLDDSPLALLLGDLAGNTLATGVRTRGDSVIDGFELPISGTYVLQIRRPGDARTDTYSPYALDLDLLSAPLSGQAQGGGLILGSAVTGVFNTAPATHTWEFEGQAGHEVSILVSRLQGHLDLTLVLSAPDGRVLVTTMPETGSTNSLPIGPITLPLDGLYRLQLVGGEDALGTLYRLYVQPRAAQNIEVAEITPLQDGFGVISPSNPTDRWSFEAEAGNAISLRLAVTQGNLAPALMLWDAEGNPLAEGVLEQNAGMQQAFISNFTIPASGRYEVSAGRVGGVAGDTAGSYRLMLRTEEISSEAAVAVDVPFGTEISGPIQAGGTAFYAFQGLAGDVVGLSLCVPQGSLLPKMFIDHEVGVQAVVPIVTLENEAMVSAYALGIDGRLVISLFADETTEYTLAVFRREPTITEGAATRNIGRGQTFLGGVESSGEPNLWLFSGQLGDVLNITVDTSSSLLRADVTLYGPDGYIANAVEQPSSRVTTLGPIRLPETGDYVLLVGPWLGGLGGTSGRYSVRIDEAPPEESGSAGGRILRNAVVTGGLIASDPEDVWTFYGGAGEAVSVRLSLTGDEGSPVIQLSGPDGTVLATQQEASTFKTFEISSITLPQDDQYTVTVRSSQELSSPLEYRLQVIRQDRTLESMKTARGIDYGDTQTGVLSASGDIRQAWVFYGQAGERISSHITFKNEAAIPGILLLGPDGNLIRFDAARFEGDTAELANIPLAQTGFYGIVVFRAVAAYPFSDEEYTIQLEKVSSGAVAQGRLAEEAVAQFSVASPVHMWEIEPTFPGSYLIEVAPLAPGASLSVFVSTTDGTLLGTGQPEGTLQNVIVKLAGGQRYLVTVSAGVVTQANGYRIRFVPANLLTSGGMLASNEPDLGRISADHLTDQWRVQGSTTLSVEVTRLAGDLIPRVAVFDSNGLLLKEQQANDRGQVSLEVNLPGDGLYNITVSRAEGSIGATVGDYSITARVE